ncbi:hypothetical protein B0H14DRAFT_3422240 [Mycena olivaceomarginata]|nr:hypothetical protein B0H14DRAFT_3422240 [Mycena olivaceomarginata]
MTPATDTRPPVLRRIVERLGGDVDAWITLENSRVPQYGPVIVSNNIISRTYELETGTRFRVSWRTRCPVTALCALVLPPFPHETKSSRVSFYIMDKTIPQTQIQAPDRWIAGPLQGHRALVQVEIRKAIKDTGYRMGYIPDPQEAQHPALVFRFNLIGVDPTPAQFVRSRNPSPVDLQVSLGKRKRGSSRQNSERESDCFQKVNVVSNGGETISDIALDLLMAAMGGPEGLHRCSEELKRLFEDKWVRKGGRRE